MITTGRRRCNRCQAKARAADPAQWSRGWKRYEFNGVKYRSTWEVAVAAIFTECGVPFEYERWDAATKSRPDFFVPAVGRYLEVHPDCHGLKTNLPPNCTLVKTLPHAKAAAFGIALRVNPDGASRYLASAHSRGVAAVYRAVCSLAVSVKRELLCRAG
jgi:hypothetical protein